MLKKSIPYKDLDGNDVVETFEFHLNRAEMAKMALGKEGKQGGFDVWVRTLINSQDGEVLVETFEQILLATVGKRSDDNKSFIKTQEIRDNFRYSEAYSVLFMELMSDTAKVTEFINGVVPSDMRDEVAKSAQTAIDSGAVPGVETKPAPVLSEPTDDRPDWLKEGRVPTDQELKGAKQEHILEAFRLRNAADKAPQQ